jgi:hypothetical protein
LLPPFRRVPVCFLHSLTRHTPPISRSDANAGTHCKRRQLPCAQTQSRSEASRVSLSRRSESRHACSRDSDTIAFWESMPPRNDSHGPTSAVLVSCSCDTAFLALFECTTRLRKSKQLFLNFDS